MSVKVGQELWWVPTEARDRHRAKTVKVTKVARKWATLDNGDRINKETGRADGGNHMSPATCYPSKFYYERCLEQKLLVKQLSDKIRFGVSEDIPPVMIHEAARLLGVELSPTPPKGETE